MTGLPEAIGPIDEASGLSPWLSGLLDQYGPLWLRLAHGFCDDHHNAEDVLSEALAALNDERSNGEVKNIPAWMSATLRNQAAKQLRREANQQRLRTEWGNKVSLEDGTTVGGDDSFVIEQAHWDKVKEELPALSPRQQEVMKLRLFEKLSPGEIAKRLGISEGAVWTAQRYAICELRRRCRGDRDDASDE